MTTAQELMKQSQTGVPGLTIGLDEEEKALGARIATGEITYDDIINGSISKIGGVDLSFPDGLVFKDNPDTVYTLDQVKNLPDGPQRLEASIKELLSGAKNQNDVKILYQDPITKEAVNGVMNQTTFGEKITDTLKYATGHSRETKAEQVVENATTVDGYLKKAGIEDVLVRQIFVDKFEVGDFFTEMDKGLDEAIRLVPYYLPLLLDYGADVVRAMGSDKDFGEFMQDTSQNRAEFAATLRNMYEDGLGVSGVTKASLLNENLHTELKKRLTDNYGSKKGLELYNQKYTTENGTPINIVGDELAENLNDFAFKQLPTSEKLLKFAAENVVIGGGFAKYVVTKDVKMAKKVAEVRQNGTYTVQRGKYSGQVIDDVAIKALSDRQIEKLIVMDGASSEIMSKLHAFTYRVGDAFKARGSAAAGANELKQMDVIDDLTDRIDVKFDEINALKIMGVSDTDSRIVKLENDIDDLVMSRNRQTFFKITRRSPIVLGNVQDEIIIAAGQAAGYELGGMIEWMGPEYGELTGALATALKAHRLVTAPIGMVGKYADQALIRSVSSGGMELVKLIDSAGGVFKALKAIDPKLRTANAKGLFVDRRLEDLNQAYFKETGKFLDRKQMMALRHLSDLTGSMSDLERGKLVDYLTESSELEDKVVNAFPPELQEEARVAFKENFASASQIPGLMAYDGMIRSGLHVKDLKNFDLNGINAIIDASNNLITQSRLVGKRLLDLGQRGKLDKDNYAIIEKFVKDIEVGVNAFEKEFAEKSGLYDVAIKTYFKNILAHPSDAASQAFDQNMLETVIEGLTTIRAAGKIPLTADGKQTVDFMNLRRDVFDEVFSEAYSTLLSASEDIKQIQGSLQGQRFSAVLAERLFDLRYNEMHLRGKQAYRNLDPKLQNTKTNVTGLFEEYLNNYADLTNQKLIFHFGKQGSFARSTHGKKLASIMNNISGNTLRKAFDGNEESLLQLRELYNKKFGTYPTDSQLYFALKDEAVLEKLEIPGVKLPDIEASFYEIEEMRRYFRDIGRKQQGTDAGSLMVDFSDELEGILKSNEEIFGELKEARKVYSQEVFFPMDQDELMSTISKNQIRLEQNNIGGSQRLKILSKDPDANVTLKYKYADKGSPEYWFNDLTDNLIKFAENPDSVSKVDLEKSFEKLVRAFGDKIDNKFDDTTFGTYGFDLTNLKGRSENRGMMKFKLLKNIAEAAIIRRWSDLRLNALEEANLLTDPDGIALPKTLISGEGLKAVKENLVKQIEVMQDIFTVPVRKLDASGNVSVVNEKLIDLTEVITKETDIAKLAKNYKEVKVEYKNLQNAYDIFKDQGKVAADTRVGVAKREVTNKLNKAAGFEGQGFAPFYKNYIEQSSLERFGAYRDLVTQGGEVAGAKVPIVMGEDDFNTAAINMLINGVLDTGEYALEGRFVQDVSGKLIPSYTFKNPLALIQEFEKTNIQDIARELLGDEHVDKINIIMKRFQRELSNESYRQIRNAGLGGIMRPVSPNEIISRAFNLARGMVSPTYVTAEMLIRIASSNGVDMMKLILSDKEVATVFSDIMTDPRGFDVQRIGSVLPRMQEFVFTQLAAKGVTNLPPMVDQEQYNKSYYSMQYNK